MMVVFGIRKYIYAIHANLFAACSISCEIGIFY